MWSNYLLSLLWKSYCFLNKVPAFLFCDVSVTLCSQSWRLHLLPLDKGDTPDLKQHGEAALRIVWHYHAVLTAGWLFREHPPPQVQISVWVLLVKIQHVSTYKRSTTLIQLKIPEQNIKWNSCTFFLQTPPSGYSFLFILASDSLFGSKLIWVVILIISLLSALKGWFLLQEGNSLLLIACCKDAELADRKCCLLYTRSMVQRTNVLYLNKQPRWGQPKAFPLCLWHSK